MGSQSDPASYLAVTKSGIIYLHNYTEMRQVLALLCLAAMTCGQRAPLIEPPEGQRCSGRNYNGRRCCTPDQPCGLGEGDCDGPLDGGVNDGHAGCRGDLVCGSNNCKKFGIYFHEKDDCCEKPAAISSAEPVQRQQEKGWGQWTQWGPCSVSCGPGYSVRTRRCVGSRCGTAGFHTQDRQEKICIAQECNDI